MRDREKTTNPARRAISDGERITMYRKPERWADPVRMVEA